MSVRSWGRKKRGERHGDIALVELRDEGLEDGGRTENAIDLSRQMLCNV
ncbi:hypothetical protein [Thermopirellula anaerolimosa]